MRDLNLIETAKREDRDRRPILGASPNRVGNSSRYDRGNTATNNSVTTINEQDRAAETDKSSNVKQFQINSWQDVQSNVSSIMKEISHLPLGVSTHKNYGNGIGASKFGADK